MRVGIDVRLTQFSQVQRGYGQFLRSLLVGLQEVSTDQEYFFLHYKSKPFPEDLQNLLPKAQRIGLDVAASWEESPSRWSHPRMQIVPVLPGKAMWKYLDSQGEELSCRAAENRLDLVFFPAPMFLGQGPLPKLSVKSLFAFHDAIPYQFREQYLDKWGGDWQKLYLQQRTSYQNADMVVADSESSREDAIQWFDMNPAKVRPVYCSMDPTFGEPVAEEEIRKAKERNRLKYPFFVFCSILDYHKNLEASVAAFAQMLDQTGKQAHLVVIGGLPEEQRESVRGMAFDKGLSGKEVIMTGHVSQTELRALFQSCSAVLSPSLAEGFGYPVLQGMLSRVPVVASDIPPYRETMGDVGLRIDPSDTDGVATALARILDDPVYARGLTEGGEEKARSFSSERQGREFLKLFGLLAESHV